MLSSEKQSLDEACKKIIQIPKVRFVGVLNKMGKRIAGGFKEGVTSYLEDKQNSDDVCPADLGISNEKGL